MNSSNGDPLVAVRGLKKHFAVRSGLFARVHGWIKAVDDISFHIGAGETLALVGESGCGKTTLGRAVLRLIEPSAGAVTVCGRDIGTLNTKQLREFRRKLQIIFQDPYSSLNPRISVGGIIGESMRVHEGASQTEAHRRVDRLLERVGLDTSFQRRFPHELSGGQRQRVGIARALALGPEFVVCDEAVSALDVSVQAQILNLLSELQRDAGLTYLFISHDLNVVRQIADRVAVMYLGKLVECADVERIFTTPMHPYTQSLIDANPIPDPNCPPTTTILEGEVPSALDPPTGCPFHTRCPQVLDRCRTTLPVTTITDTGHTVACHLYAQS